ncbi:low molecular weight protein-tyrosine-phosphatase [Vibrio algarum]|uniref:protein-tyrosine-phosphatase n=1 Tax=Vibrio algarum TaxID=3020714 RepID=A0ABT4YSN8_9VIBR|nr:low molecular weight protein-tyrosine-phosphatase [Vibrio sp. KJ40-1]MDB1124427.1 low molecular weight phosphotyrosine protein phosphatase [Vibrio sp. KJ40-1]
MKKILVVCMGNICRSPTGEAVLRATAKKMNLPIEVDSAGTLDFHSGNEPDFRARTAGEYRGYSFDGIVARQVSPKDFEYFDIILAADRDNMSELLGMCPIEHTHKISLFLRHSKSGYNEIPDPYYGGDNGFELVLDLIEEASIELLKKL